MNTPLFGLLTLLLLALAHPVAAQASNDPIPLWPQTAPGDKGELGEEHDTTKASDGLVAGKTVIRTGNVSRPTITICRPPKEKDTGAAVVVCPGGGYYILAMDLEGTEIVEWLNSIGVTGILLKYRVPVRADRERYDAPLQDVQRAMGLARKNAKAWGIDPQRLGVMGFSAGGHLSAALSCNYEKRNYEAIDDADQLSSRPDFVMLVYPAYLTLEKERDKVSPELKITAQTPPTFIVQSQDDPVPIDGSLFYYRALKDAKVKVEMHLYPTGGHGYGLRPTAEPITGWPKLAEQWLKNSGWLEPVKK